MSLSNLINFKFKLKNNNIFTSKFMLQYGIHLGGHIHLLQIEISSIIFGIRTKNSIINLNSTSLELIKVLNIVKNLGLQRQIIYFINSILSFRLCFKYTFNKFNKHLFFPIEPGIHNVFRKFDHLEFSKKELKELSIKSQKYENFLLRSGKSLLQKIFVSSKWSYGFVSNSKTFFQFTDNVLHEKVKFGKIISTFQEKIEELVDYYPFLPNYGFIGDHHRNCWIVNEFRMAQVANSSIIDTFTTKSLFSMYGIPGNACSIDTTLFFLILMLSNYLLGFYQQIHKFCFKKSLQLKILKNNFSRIKKNYFFKNLKNFNLKNV